MQKLAKTNTIKKQNMPKTNCPFCDTKNISKDTLFENKYFMVKVGIGIITPGHVMIITKRHLPSFADITNQERTSYLKLKKRLVAFLEKKFAIPFFVEYGAWGQSVKHAHTHFVPLSGNGYKLKNVKEVFPMDFFKISNWRALKKIREKNNGYVLIGQGEKEFAAYDLPEEYGESAKKFYFRYFFAQVKKIPGVRDWRIMSEKEKTDDEQKRQITKEIFAAGF